MGEYVVAALGAVGITFRMRMAGAGRRQRLEAQALQVARAADVPRIGNDEAAGFVKLMKSLALVGGGWTRARHGNLRDVAVGQACHGGATGKSAFANAIDQVLSRSATWARYFSYSARVIRPPSRATRSWSRFDSEACTSSTRFHAASGACDPGCGTYSDSATLR